MAEENKIKVWTSFDIYNHRLWEFKPDMEFVEFKVVAGLQKELKAIRNIARPYSCDEGTDFEACNSGRLEEVYKRLSKLLNDEVFGKVKKEKK